MPRNNNVVNLFDVMPSGGAQDPNDPIIVAASGQVISAKSPKALVQKLQYLLTSWGFAPGSADGIYGTNTANAVRGLQTKLDVAADGFFGPATAIAVQNDLAKGPASLLRANQTLFAPPKLLPPAPGAQAAPPSAASPLPATQPAVATGIPWWVWLGGAAAVLFLVTRTRDLEDTPLAPPGSVVMNDLGDDEDGFAEVEEVEEEPAPPPKPKKKRKPRKKKVAVAEVVSEVKTPDEVLPPEDDNVVDVDFVQV